MANNPNAAAYAIPAGLIPIVPVAAGLPSTAGGLGAGAGASVLGSAGSGASAASGSGTVVNKADQEFLEVNSVSLEWKLGNLKQLFDSSKGELKSKCVKSSFFGGGKWQVFFYSNSGHDQYCSLYLSCQPTLEECEKGALAAGLSTASGPAAGKVTDPTQVPWVREGLFKFTFEIKSTDRKYTFKAMEATDHAFSHEARNWGWAQYWRRNDAYYNNQQAKYHDSFLICCTIVYSPSPPSPPPPLTRRMVPNDLLDAYASLFDDPDNSDVRFKIVKKRRHPLTGQRLRIEYSIYASRKILGRRSEYFAAMFESGFKEGHVGGSPNLSTSNNVEATTMLQTASGSGSGGGGGAQIMAIASPSHSPVRRVADPRRHSVPPGDVMIDEDAILEDEEDDEDSDSILGLGDASASFEGSTRIGSGLLPDQPWTETDEDEDEAEEGDEEDDRGAESEDLDMLDGDGDEGGLKPDDAESSSDIVGDALVPRGSTPAHTHARGASLEPHPPLSSDGGPTHGHSNNKLGSPTPRAGSAAPRFQHAVHRGSAPLADDGDGDGLNKDGRRGSLALPVGDQAANRASSVPSEATRGGTPGADASRRQSVQETPINTRAGVPSSVQAGRRTPDDDVRMVGVQEDEPMFDAVHRDGDAHLAASVSDTDNLGGGGTGKGGRKSSGVIRRDKASLAAARKKAQREKEVLVIRGDKRRRNGERGSGEGTGRWRAEVTVTDASYHTFRALLYYLYTDSITFAPLASAYLCARDAAASTGTPFPFANRKDFVKASMARVPNVPGQPQGPGPCSAKAIYRLADKIGLPELKARAFEHIVRSLTPQNIPMEVFSSFTSAYEEIRKVEIEFMLRSWNEVRDSQSMRLVLGSLRDGRLFPGFADVWRLLLANLEYRPKTDAAASADAATAGQEGGH